MRYNSAAFDYFIRMSFASRTFHLAFTSALSFTPEFMTAVGPITSLHLYEQSFFIFRVNITVTFECKLCDEKGPRLDTNVVREGGHLTSGHTGTLHLCVCQVVSTLSHTKKTS